MSTEAKVALVTGGSGGLGSVHCLSLADAGYKVAVVAHNHMEKAKDVVAQIVKKGKQAMALKMDVANAEEVEAGVASVEKTLGPVDVLVNNAADGIVRAVTIVKMKAEDWVHDLNVNLTGPFNTIKRCLPGMTERGWGRIINVSSIAGTMGGAGQCSYAATKSGLIGLTKTVALETARKGVTCNAVVLGIVDGGAFHEVTPEFQERIAKSIAIRRAGTPQEISNVVVFLASEGASYITGEAIEVSGGAGLFIF
ncbi:MAG: SDR family NAD(P)-dependent oxidoreductase [Dehalococcoidales bacterium]|jgi:3-oxoacyl-[acyl-carrier protein] reductase